MINVFFQKYRLVIISTSIVVALALLLVFSFSQNENVDMPAAITLNPAKEFETPNNTTPLNSNADEANEESLEARPGLQKKETLLDGTVKNYFTSSVATRPNIIITKGSEEILFQSSVTDPAFPVKISDYTESYGPA